MSLIAPKPLRGMRLLLVLGRDPRRYEGTARTPHESWDVRVKLEGDVDVETNAPKDVGDWVRRVVRIVVRGAESDGTRLPRQIHRWRAEKE